MWDTSQLTSDWVASDFRVFQSVPLLGWCSLPTARPFKFQTPIHLSRGQRVNGRLWARQPAVEYMECCHFCWCMHFVTEWLNSWQFSSYFVFLFFAFFFIFFIFIGGMTQTHYSKVTIVSPFCCETIPVSYQLIFERRKIRREGEMTLSSWIGLLPCLYFSITHRTYYTYIPLIFK